MLDVTALGELLIDFASLETDGDGYPTMKANAGGAPANFLAALNQYGHSVAMLGKVGNDTFGHLLLDTLDKTGIGTHGIVVDSNVFTTMAFVTFDDEGDRTFSFARKPGADTQLGFEELKLSLIDESKVLHFGSLSLTDQPMRDTTQRAIAYAKNKGKMITYDPNLRIPLWDDLEEAREQILWGLHQADFVKISDEEVTFLWDCDSQVGAHRILEECGVSLVLLTLGDRGSIAMNLQAKGIAHCPSVTPIDTTGAGDICGGSALSCVLDMKKPLGALTQEDLTYIAQFASTAASLSTQKRGGIPSIPQYQEVLDHM